jgi:hypothetical protein
MTPRERKDRRSLIIIPVIFLVISIAGLISAFKITAKVHQKMAEDQLSKYVQKAHHTQLVQNNELKFTLNIIQGWANLGILYENDREEFDKKFYSLLNSGPQVSAISVADINGSAYLIRRDETYIETYFSDEDTKEKKQLRIIDQNGGVMFSGDSLIKTSVTSLATYQSQLTTEYDTIYRYPVQAIPGTTTLFGTGFSLRTKDSVNQNEYIVSGYRSLKVIYNQLISIIDQTNIEIFLFTLDGSFFDFEKLDLSFSELAKEEGYLSVIDSAQNTPFYEAFHYWQKNSPKDSSDFDVNIKYNGQKYWAYFEPSSEVKNGVWLAYIMPEADFSVLARGRMQSIFIISVIVLVLSLLAMAYLLRRIQYKPQSFIPLEADELLQLIKEGEGVQMEFKSTLRYNLHSNKMGKEIELAWLKSVVAFCNTDGGRILIGVKDNGEILGLDSDRFPNEDKTLLHVQNLIKQHIGLQFSKYIDYSLQTIDNKQILVVRCKPASKPVFLRFADKEQFFVRTGPASIELPVSKALEYIQNRSED